MRRFVLGMQAAAFVREELAGGRALARHLLNTPPFTHTITVAPEGSSPEDLADFRGGCLGDTSETRRWVHSVAMEYLAGQSSARRYLICEHSQARKSDPFLVGKTDPYFTNGDDVYFVLGGEGASLEKVRRTFQAGGFYPTIAVLTSLPGDLPIIEARSEQSATNIQMLAQRTEHLLVGAYDEEGWLLCSRPPGGVVSGSPDPVDG